jgi:hypothetical protein
MARVGVKIGYSPAGIVIPPTAALKAHPIIRRKTRCETISTCDETFAQPCVTHGLLRHRQHHPLIDHRVDGEFFTSVSCNTGNANLHTKRLRRITNVMMSAQASKAREGSGAGESSMWPRVMLGLMTAEVEPWKN